MLHVCGIYRARANKTQAAHTSATRCLFVASALGVATAARAFHDQPLIISSLDPFAFVCRFTERHVRNKLRRFIKNKPNLFTFENAISLIHSMKTF
jgi:hypothetical protein